jgi:hypothetical protein
MKKFLGMVLSCVFIQISVVDKLTAQTSISQAQAVFIYNFTRLIEWPTEYKTGEFVIGVYN